MARIANYVKPRCKMPHSSLDLPARYSSIAFSASLFSLPAFASRSNCASRSLFASCTSPNTNGNLEDQIATSVAGTLQAQGLPAQTEPTAAPLDGEVLPQGSYGDCANSGQLSLAYISSGSGWLWVQGGA